MLIYKFTNLINGKVYIGKTKNSFNSRMSSHKSFSKKEKPSQLIHKAIKKYGWSNFKKEILEEKIDNIEALNKKEIYYISLYGSTNSNVGYNLTLGGDGGHGLIGEKSSLFGKKRPELSERNKKNKGKTYEDIYGKEKSDELKKNTSILATGRKLSKEARNKISESRKIMWENGVYDKPETREKFSYNKGKPSPNRKRVYSPELDMEFESLSSAAFFIKTGPGNICSVLKGKLKHIKGFTFKYLENKNGL